MMRNNRTIALTGGVGSGKSRILEILQKEYGAYVLFADKVAAELEEPGQEGYRLLVEAFGTGILGADHRLDRQAFAQMIFQDSRLLSSQEKISYTHNPLTALYSNCLYHHPAMLLIPS